MNADDNLTMAPGFSQTILELYLQLGAADWSEADIKDVSAAYKLAVERFSGTYRPSGKHFLHHLVGSASIAAWCGQSPDVVKAMLVHAIYAHGDFGLVKNKREVVTKSTGSGVEAVVWAYHNLAWSP